ncbi:MAG: DNA polymerase I [Ruminococcaceae bacterium]|nr:DNA polymerase I [Oscillospiraceae bacterium]
MKRYLILDGNSIINRAFYAIKLLTNKHGVYTNGVYGFLSILFKHLEQYEPDCVSVAFDLKAPTFRHKKYPLYKAQRKGMPQELAMQMPIVKEVLRAMNIKIYEQEGYEADDIIGTVSRLCQEQGMECLILTGDKDDLQLAADNTKILLTVSRGGATETNVFDRARMTEEYGVTPEEFIHVKALMGDTSDNIPGVPGIGEKTAFALIGQFKSLDNLYANLSDPAIKPAARKKLEEGRESAYLSLELATIDRAVPGDFPVAEDVHGAYDNEKLASLFENLDFHAFLKKLDLAGSPKQDTPEVTFVALEDADALVDALGKAENELIYRLYVSGGDLYAFAFLTENTVYYLACSMVVTQDKIAMAIKPVMENPSCTRITYGVKEDIALLAEYGVQYADPYFDVGVGAYVLDPTRTSYDIGSIAAEFLSMNLPDDEAVFGKGKSRREMEELTEDEIRHYVSGELVAAYALFCHQKTEVEKLGQSKLLYEIEFPLIRVLSSMETTGFSVDKAQLAAFGTMLSERIDVLEGDIYSLCGCEFNIGSPKQLGEVLFDKLGLRAIKKTKTGYSTNAEVLEKLIGDHPVIEKIIEYRQLTKLKSTYADGLTPLIGADGKIHSKFNQTVTATGRISSTEPNLQNIPMRTELGREIRKMFVPSSPEYTLVDADYSQIELRILAHLAEDENMIAAFQSGMDIHTNTAMNVFHVAESEITPLLRSRAKAVNFGIAYGMGSFSLSQDLHIPTAEAKEYIDNYFAKYQGVKRFMDQTIADATQTGYVTTDFGRRRYIPEITSTNHMLRAAGERMAMNTPIQGTAADIIKIAMVKVYRALQEKGLKSRLILQVHDELIIEAHRDEADEVQALLVECMEGAASLRAPLIAEAGRGDSWYDAH